MAKYDNILGVVGNTPVVKINKLAPNHVNRAKLAFPFTRGRRSPVSRWMT